MAPISQARLSLLSRGCLSTGILRTEGFLSFLRFSPREIRLEKPGYAPISTIDGYHCLNKSLDLRARGKISHHRYYSSSIVQFKDKLCSPSKLVNVITPLCESLNHLSRNDHFLIEPIRNVCSYHDYNHFHALSTAPPVPNSSSTANFIIAITQQKIRLLIQRKRMKENIMKARQNPVCCFPDTTPGLAHNFSSCSDQQDSHNRQNTGPNRVRLAYLLSASLFSLSYKKEADEDDEEWSKLSDKEKLQKMTPTELCIARGVLSMCDQDYSTADMQFHEALRLAQDEKNEDKETLVLNLLACNYFENGQFEEAERLFISLIKRLITFDVDPADPAILELSLKLASIYSKSPETHEKATKGFKFVINNLLTKLQDVLNSSGELKTRDVGDDRKNDLALLGWGYDWFAKHLLAIKDYEGAVILLKRALEISSIILGPIHDQTLILLNDVGTTLALNDIPKEGKIFMQKAVEGAIENQSNELASFYVNLGLVNLKLRLLNEAKLYCQNSMELARRYNEHHNSAEVIQLSTDCLDEIEHLSEIGLSD